MNWGPTNSLSIFLRPQVPATGYDLPYPQGHAPNLQSADDPHDTYTAVEIVKAPSASKKSDNFISWSAFLKEYLPQIVEELSPAYEEDFRIFRIYNMAQCVNLDNPKELRRKFMTARVLFDLLKAGGLWGFKYEIPRKQVLNRPPALLKKIEDAASKGDGASRRYLFTDDCDNISFLFAEIAGKLGLKGVEVKLVFDNHVNIFVPLGGNLVLRMDLTGIGDFSGGLPWNLQKTEYVPEGKIPEDYNKTILEPVNKHYRKGEQIYEKALGSLYLSRQAFKNLIARLNPIKIPPKWMPFIRGYQHAKGCYKKYLEKYLFDTVEEAVQSAKDLDLQHRQEIDDHHYFSCLEELHSPLEQLGMALGYLYWTHCLPPPPVLNIKAPKSAPHYNFIACAMMMTAGAFWLRLDYIKKSFHEKEEKLTIKEADQLKNSMDILGKIDPNQLRYPEKNTLGDWLFWIQKKLPTDVVSPLADLFHMIESHPTAPLSE